MFRELSELELSLPKKKKSLTKAETELKVVGEGWERLSQQVRTCRTQVEEAKSSFQAHRSRGQVLEALMVQQASGAIPGIHGRLVRNIMFGVWWFRFTSGVHIGFRLRGGGGGGGKSRRGSEAAIFSGLIFESPKFQGFLAYSFCLEIVHVSSR